MHAPGINLSVAGIPEGGDDDDDGALLAPREGGRVEGKGNSPRPERETGHTNERTGEGGGEHNNH